MFNAMGKPSQVGWCAWRALLALKLGLCCAGLAWGGGQKFGETWDTPYKDQVEINGAAPQRECHVTPFITTMPVTGGDDNVTVCCSGLVLGDHIGVSVPMRMFSFGAPIYERQDTFQFSDNEICFEYPIPGTTLDLPDSGSLSMPIIVQTAEGTLVVVHGAALIWSGPDETPAKSVQDGPDGFPGVRLGLISDGGSPIAPGMVLDGGTPIKTQDEK